MASPSPLAWSSFTTSAEKEAFLRKILQHYKFALSDEIACQDSIEEKLKLHQVPYQREVKLGTYGIIDFVVDGTIGVEVKIKGQRMPIFRQCKRYCQSAQIEKLILATMYPMQLPPDIEGIPAFAISMANAQLKRIV